MKYPCNVICDLLPLFVDGVCSDESAEIVRDHLAECAACREKLQQLQTAEEGIPAAEDPDMERLRAKSLVKVQLVINRRKLRLWALIIALVLLLGGVLYLWNDHGEMRMPYNETMRVFYNEENDLVVTADLPCSADVGMICIPAEENASGETHVFLRYYCRPLDYLFGKLTGYRVDSAFVIAFDERNAQHIDAVHFVEKGFEESWFRGDVPLTAAELDMYIENSVTVWTKE